MHGNVELWHLANSLSLLRAAGSAGGLALEADATNSVEVFGLQEVFAPACCGGRGCMGTCW